MSPQPAACAEAKHVQRQFGAELGVTVKAACLAPLTFASHAYEDFHLLMPLNVCWKWEGLRSGSTGRR
jgi:8-oxo-dGTP diphosphatase